MTEFVMNDGGRALTSRMGTTGDCVVRAIAIALAQPYDEVFRELASQHKWLEATRLADDGWSQLVFEPYMSQQGHKAKKGSRPHGREINPEEFPNGLSWLVYDPYLRKHGYHWKAAPKVIGRRAVAADLPMGRLIANQEHHLVAVVNGVVHDTWDSRNDPVYGYYAPENLS